LSGYGEKNLEHMRKVSEKYDPEGVFQTMVPGGFKLRNAGLRALESKGKTGSA
jgi:hypothetical protein